MTSMTGVENYNSFASLRLIGERKNLGKRYALVILLNILSDQIPPQIVLRAMASEI